MSAQAKKLVNGRGILLRMDSGNDAMENYALAAEEGLGGRGVEPFLST